MPGRAKPFGPKVLSLPPSANSDLNVSTILSCPTRLSTDAPMCRASMSRNSRCWRRGGVSTRGESTRDFCSWNEESRENLPGVISDSFSRRLCFVSRVWRGFHFVIRFQATVSADASFRWGLRAECESGLGWWCLVRMITSKVINQKLRLVKPAALAQEGG